MFALAGQDDLLMKVENRFTVAVAVAMLASAPAMAVSGSAKAALTKMKAINLIVLQDYNASADVEGKTYVGGNLSGNASLGIGASANAGQTATDTGYHSTLAVGGQNNGQINLNHGNGAGDHYGAYIVGSAGNLSVNAQNAVVRVGSLPNNLNLTSGSSLYVRGDANGISAGTGNVIRIGGNATNGNYNLSGAGNSIEVVGSLSNVNLASNSVNKVGGNVNNVNGASGAKLYVHGSIGGSQNANGATFSQGYTFNATVPAPTIPVVASLATTTAQLTADVQALSTALGGLTIVNNPSSITYSSQGPTFHAVSSGGSDPYAVFTVNESIFNYSEVNYDFANSTLPVIINVVNSNASAHANHTATYNWNLNPVGGANNSHNQQVIWNFTDASTLNLNRKVEGSILAPYATVANSGDINGSVVAKIFNQSGEVHLGTYARNINILPSESMSATPEPAVWIQLITGFGLAGAVMRRRRFISIKA